MKILGYAKLERLSRVGVGRLRRRIRAAGPRLRGNLSSRTQGSGVRHSRSELGRESSVRETGGGRIVLYRSLPPISVDMEPSASVGSKPRWRSRYADQRTENDADGLTSLGLDTTEQLRCPN